MPLKKHSTNKAQVKTICHNENRLTEPKTRTHSEGLWWPTKGPNPVKERWGEDGGGQRLRERQIWQEIIFI